MASAGAPQPSAILRGHKSQVHAARFIRNNSRLVTGDADGFVAVWDLTIMRARAVWRAHEKTILAVEEWGSERLITYVAPHPEVPGQEPNLNFLATGGTMS